MKIFISKEEHCNLNYQADFILGELTNNFEITSDPKEADIIIFNGTCCSTQYNVYYTLNNIKKILDLKKEGAKTFLTGCITRPFKDRGDLIKYQNWIKNNIDYVIPYDKPDLLLKLIASEMFKELNPLSCQASIDTDNDGEIYISDGCLNNCTFCKVNYQDYPLKSLPIDYIKEMIDILDWEKCQEVYLKGMNICQYGLDLYNEYRLPEIIEYLETKNNIKRVRLIGFAFKDAIRSNLETTLADSKKVVELSGGLESGSDRILSLINKGFTGGEVINFVKKIREKYFKDLYLNVIAGFPTETLEDVKRTLEVLKILNPYRVAVCKYRNSEWVDANKYKQLSQIQINEHARILKRVLQRRSVDWEVV